MDPTAIAALAIAMLNLASQLILEIRSHGGLSDEQLQQLALDNDATTRQHIADFLKTLPSA